MTAGASSPSGEGRCLVVTADDFGRSPSVNRAVATACDRGVLTAASIVAAGDAFEEAVDLAARYPELSVGLHIMLSDGRPVLSAADIPGLVDAEGRFERSPMRAGIAYWRLRKEPCRPDRGRGESAVRQGGKGRHPPYPCRLPSPSPYAPAPVRYHREGGSPEGRRLDKDTPRAFISRARPPCVASGREGLFHAAGFRTSRRPEFTGSPQTRTAGRGQRVRAFRNREDG